MKLPQMIHGHKTTPFNRAWWPIALIAIVAFAAIVWLTDRQSNQSPIPQKSILEETNVQGATLPLNNFSTFISKAKTSEIPKTFSSETLIIEESDARRISTSLEKFPLATIRIEGFSSYGGDLTRMKDLAFKRALSVKEKLVALGINPDRIDTVGNASKENKVAIIITSIE